MKNDYFELEEKIEKFIKTRSGLEFFRKKE